MRPEHWSLPFLGLWSANFINNAVLYISCFTMTIANKRQVVNHCKKKTWFHFNLLLFSHSVVSDSLWLHGLQNARLPCPSQSPRACSKLFPLNWLIRKNQNSLSEQSPALNYPSPSYVWQIYSMYKSSISFTFTDKTFHSLVFILYD